MRGGLNRPNLVNDFSQLLRWHGHCPRGDWYSPSNPIDGVCKGCFVPWHRYTQDEQKDHDQWCPKWWWCLVQPSKEIIHVLPESMSMCQEGVTRSHHDARQAPPIPAACTGSKVQCDASVELPIGMETQQATISGGNQDPAMGFWHIQSELSHLLFWHSHGSTLHHIRNPGQEHVIGKDCIRCHHTDGAVSDKSWRATWCENRSQFTYGRLGIHLFELCHAPGTWAMKPASNSSWISDCTISGWSWALFHESRQSWSGTSSGKVPVYAGQAKDAFKGSLTPNGTPWGNSSRKPASGSPKNVARRCHNCNLNGWPGAPGLAGTSVILCSQAVARQWFESNAGCHWASWTISIEVRQGDHVVEDSYCRAVLGSPPPSSTRPGGVGHDGFLGKIEYHGPAHRLSEKAEWL